MQIQLPDYHVHTCFSGDSDASLKDVLARAVSLSLPEICITDHMDFDYPNQPDFFLFDVQEYFSSLMALREEYADRLSVRIGVELGLQPYLSGKLCDFIEKYPFDFVIGSSHIIDHADPYYPEFWEGRKPEAIVRHYFESVLENINAFSDFDIYGHLDYIVRYCPDRAFVYHCEEYMDIIEECLRALIEKGKGIEVNTAGFFYGDSPNPHKKILCRYRELGGEILTVGSDSHTPEKMAWNFTMVREMLLSCGFSYVTTFANRKASFMPL